MRTRSSSVSCFAHSGVLTALVFLQLHSASVRLSSQEMVLAVSGCVRLYCVARRYRVGTYPTLPYYAAAAEHNETMRLWSAEDTTIRLWSAELYNQCLPDKTLRAAVRRHGFKLLEELLQLCVFLI